ncbi:hypothetical protein [Sphingopyxis sp. KK2]|uniref:hypothetical protein n=1 Tax=Sphingopyxis sp. KK2 TaxID=1855727 RepID=UPI00097E72B2|nr:hypothetical protein [Sphingopyxis sp. KK2]
MKWFIAILVASTVALILASLILTSRRSHADGSDRISSEPIPASQASITVQGWRNNELRKILSDFGQKYGLDQGLMTVETDDDGVSAVRFHSEIPADVFVFLVNYIHYPNDFDLSGRRISAIGNSVLDKQFGLSGEEFSGKGVRFYVPADDREYDEVYAQIDGARYFRVSFTDLSWTPVSDPRMPAG